MSQGRILVVEDELAIGQLIDMELSAAGFEILHAPDGATAIRLAALGRPHLFLVDYALPDMDGAEVIRRLRAGSDSPLVVISGFTDAEHKDAAMAAGATEYIAKPFDGEVLADLCRALLSDLSEAASA
jgi:two-component system KDP operon response regulator KdpE